MDEEWFEAYFAFTESFCSMCLNFGYLTNISLERLILLISTVHPFILIGLASAYYYISRSAASEES